MGSETEKPVKVKQCMSSSYMYMYAKQITLRKIFSTYNEYAVFTTLVIRKRRLFSTFHNVTNTRYKHILTEKKNHVAGKSSVEYHFLEATKQSGISDVSSNGVLALIFTSGALIMQ